MKISVLLGLSLIAVSSAAFAIDCEEKFSNPADAVTCLEKQSFDKVIRHYNQLLQITKKNALYAKYGLAPLIQSQKNWLKYRDSYCDSYSTYHGEIYNHANCIIQLNDDRASQLENDIRVAGE